MRALVESVPNFAVGFRDGAIRASLASAAAVSGATVLDSSFDSDHSRLVLSLGLPTPHPADSVFAVAAAAVELIDLRSHAGVHPRRGAADVVPFVPVGSASLSDCVVLARELGERVWAELGVPVHFYGAAATGVRTLAEIRSASPPPPDLGDEPHPSAGVMSIGARLPLVAYNVLLDGIRLPEAHALARSLRESSGGVRGIQALVFEVSSGIQLSMNLTRLGECGPARAMTETLVRLPPAASVRSEEVVGLCPAAAAAGCAAADGKLLEARLAGCAARLAATACAARGVGSEEMRRLGERLASEAASLDGLGFGEALAGAERAAALRRVLRAGGVAAPEADLLLAVASEGLRAALPTAVKGAFPERLAALDRWLREDSAG